MQQSTTRQRAPQPWRAWYKTVRWQRLKERVHLRDGYVCAKTGVLCIGRHPAGNSPVAHHDVPHRGDEARFWDEASIVTVSKAWHDSEAQKAEQASRDERGVWY